MIEEDTFDREKLNELASEMTVKLTRFITSQAASREMYVAALIAVAHVLVIMTRAMVGKDRVLDIITAVVSKALHSVEEEKSEANK